MKKTTVSRLSLRTVPARSPVEHWHNGADIETCLYARSLQRAAKSLLTNIEMDRDAASEWDACPAVFLYRQSIEIYLKLLVGEGSAFLPSPVDHLTLYKTHSVRWLAQITCQIIRAVGWETTFICEGISSLAEFSTVVDELEELDPVAHTVHSANQGRVVGAPPHQLLSINVVPFTKNLDALLALLDATADALAATTLAEDSDPNETIQ